MISESATESILSASTKITFSPSNLLIHLSSGSILFSLMICDIYTFPILRSSRFHLVWRKAMSGSESSQNSLKSLILAPFGS